jgi:hypothetical protein
LLAPGPLAFQLQQGQRSWSARLRGSVIGSLAFNVATHPSGYGLLSRLPGLGLGATRFHELDDVHSIAESSRLAGALQQFRAAASYDSSRWDAAVESWKSLGFTRLPSQGEVSAEPLRLPVLAPSREVRDRVVAALEARGLGATRMYGEPLPQITGVPDVVAQQGSFPNAAQLADRLFTLPTHGAVGEADIVRTRQLIDRCVGDQGTRR